MSLRLAGKIPRIRQSINTVPRSILTEACEQCQAILKRISHQVGGGRKLFLLCGVAVVLPCKDEAIFPRLIWVAHCGERSVGLTRLMLTPVSRRHAAVRMDAARTP